MDIADIVKVGYLAYVEIDRTLKLSRESNTDADTALAVIVGINNLAHTIIEMAGSNQEEQMGETTLADPEEEPQEEVTEEEKEDEEEDDQEDLSEQEKESIQALGDEIFGKRRRGRPKRNGI